MPKPYVAGLVDGRNQRCNTACDHLSRVRRVKAASKKKVLFSQDVKAPPKYYFAALSFFRASTWEICKSINSFDAYDANIRLYMLCALCRSFRAIKSITYGKLDGTDGSPHPLGYNRAFPGFSAVFHSLCGALCGPKCGHKFRCISYLTSDTWTTVRSGGPGGTTENELNQLLAEKWDRNAPYDSFMFFKSPAPQI